MDARELDSLTDSLVRQAGRGEQDAIARVLDILHGELAALIRRAHIHPNDRDDAAQDAVLIVMACLNTYDPGLGTFRAYACVSVRKMLIKFHELRGSIKRPSELIIDWLGDGPSVLAYEESTAGIEAMDALAEAPHADIVRDYFGIGGQPELSVNQIAARRKMAPRRVRAALTEALEVMRETS